MEFHDANIFNKDKKIILVDIDETIAELSLIHI